MKDSGLQFFEKFSIGKKCIKMCKLKNLPFFLLFLDFGLISKTVFFDKKWKFMEKCFRLGQLESPDHACRRACNVFSVYFLRFRIEKSILCQKHPKSSQQTGFAT